MESKLIFCSKNIPHFPILSLLIPTFNCNNLLHEALLSVAQAKKCNINFEVIVCSNNPNESFENLIEEFNFLPIKFYVNAENYEQVGNINRCCELARGKYVAYLHDDDLILPNYFEMINRYVFSSKDYDCVLPSYYTIGEKYIIDFKHRLLNFIFIFRILYRKTMQRITVKNCIYSFDNVYGAPTCGCVFLRSSIIKFNFFKNVNGAAWDFYNFRLYNKNNNIYVLHKFVGVRRSTTGMSKRDDVKLQFLKDKEDFIAENLDNNFMKKYGKIILNKKPKLIYCFIRLITKTYFYIHNLDAEFCASKKLFNKYYKKV